MQLPLRTYWHILHQYLAPQKVPALVTAVSLLASIGLRPLGPHVVRAIGPPGWAGPSHRPAVLRQAHRIIVLDGGRIVGCGRLEELLETCPEMRELWSAAGGGVSPS